MTGRSWHRGCPVGRAGLRLVRDQLLGLRRLPLPRRDGAERRRRRSRAARCRACTAGRYRSGGCTASTGSAGARTARRQRLRLHARRQHLGLQLPQRRRTGRRLSPHAHGRAVDINTWENPYRSRPGWSRTRGGPPAATRSSRGGRVAPGRADLARRTASAGPTAPATASTSTDAGQAARRPALHRLTVLVQSSFHLGSLSHSSLRSLTFSSAREASASRRVGTEPVGVACTGSRARPGGA